MENATLRRTKDERIQILIEPDLKQRAEQAAALMPEFSLSAWIRQAMREKLEREKFERDSIAEAA